jgi:uncharacterized protein YfaT (DUF1175 family)
MKVVGISSFLTLCACLVGAKSFDQFKKVSVLPATVEPAHIVADGRETAILSIRSFSSERPVILFAGDNRGAVIEKVEKQRDRWNATIRAGVLPGPLSLRVEVAGYRTATVQLTTLPDYTDRASDGTPDFLRLDDDQDQESFRSWFVWLAEVQYFRPPENRPREIDDCAALIRYAYREALHAHDSAWANASGLPEFPQFDSPGKYHYPFTPLAAALFRSKPGPFQPADLRNGAFLQFADAQTLWRFNTYLISRNIADALPGDLLFFRREVGPEAFHSMIYVGSSNLRPDRRRYLIYHTGPTHSGTQIDPGEIRRPAEEELLRFPQPEWRPVASNPAFLGVFRWNILRRFTNESDALPR